MQDFLDKLTQDHDFKGEIESNFVSRFVHATDNSIYQKIPQAIITPKNIADIQKIVKTAQNFPEIFFASRGGGTGTNGQSLTEGIILDLKKYINNITKIDISSGFIEVEPGVILADVNQALEKHKYHFPVDISPHDRATIGGMVATDACGSGSYHHGRMGDNILAIKYIDHDGKIQIIDEYNYPNELSEILQLTSANKDSILKNFPDHIRYASGYNLLKLLKTQNFNYLFAGSEGTLGIIISIKLKITRTKPNRALIVNYYQNFKDSINDVVHIMKEPPYSIETMNETILELSRQDNSSAEIQAKLLNNQDFKALSLIELKAESNKELISAIARFKKNFQTSLSGDYQIFKESEDIKALYLMRKNAVGIAAKLDPNKHPIAFIEDTAIPIIYLNDYISELTGLLDKNKLKYVIYGHADVGLVHVRPALNLELAEDKKLLIKLTKTVIQLVKKYDGVIWGEHSSGFRSPIVSEYYDKTIIEIFKSIKKICDPNNIFNPGKIICENDKQNINLIEDLQADFNKTITQKLKSQFTQTLMCNGNTKCLSNDDKQLMCPTYKVSHKLEQSPKGRSQLIRLWLSLISKKSIYQNKQSKLSFAKANRKIFEKIYQNLNNCLACTACTSSCPVNVSISEQKSKFFNSYFQFYKKSKQVILLENLEVILCKSYKVRYFIKYFMKIQILKNLTEEFFNLKAVNTEFQNNNIKISHKVESGKTYIFSDIATLLYAPEIIEASSNILNKLGINHEILSPMPTAIGFEHFGNSRKLTKYNNLLIKKLKTAERIIILDPAIYYLMHKNLKNEITLKSFIDVIYQEKAKLQKTQNHKITNIKLF